ncbi:MAG: type II toxin-antitoxin system Phd/YefM family antitoxin [Leucobacter sp.]
MTQAIPVGKLRQNPTDYLRAVAEGASFVITNHRKPVADLVPHRKASGISGAELMNRIRKVHRDDTWLEELRESRATSQGRDPWE